MVRVEKAGSGFVITGHDGQRHVAGDEVSRDRILASLKNSPADFSEMTQEELARMRRER